MIAEPEAVAAAWVYLRSECGLWTVGHYDPEGRWEPESDHPDANSAAERVSLLNGGRAPHPQTPPEQAKPEPQAEPGGEWDMAEIEEAFDDACRARDGAGFLGTPAECINYLASEVMALEAQLTARPADHQPEPHQCVCGSWGVCYDCGPQPEPQAEPDAVREALRNIVDAKNSYRDWQNGVRDDGPSGEARCQHLFRCIDTLDAALAELHGPQCDWHFGQYDFECNCGATRPKTLGYRQAVISAAEYRLKEAKADYETALNEVLEAQGSADMPELSEAELALMGLPEDAAAELARFARQWRDLRQPLMAPAAEHRRRERLEREAGFRLANAALLWLWHQEHPVARRTPSGEAAPSPPAEVVEALRNLHEVACNYETTRSGDLSAALNRAGRILDRRG